MSITILTGSPGHGKSYALVLAIDLAISRGKLVATNVPLREDWAEVMAKRHTPFARFREDTVKLKALEYRHRVFISENWSELARVRLEGEGEGRGLLVLDEAGDALDNIVSLQERKARKFLHSYLRRHRHLGFDALIAVQDEANLETNVRRLGEFRAEVRNFKKMPVIGAILKVNLFLKVTRWNDRAKTKAGISLYLLKKSIASLYSTHALGARDSWEDDAIILPSNPSTRLKLAPGPADIEVCKPNGVPQADSGDWVPPYRLKSTTSDGRSPGTDRSAAS